MQNVTTRNATYEDWSLIQEVYRASAGTSLLLDEEEWDRWIENKGLLLGELDGRVVGFGGIDVTATEQLKWLFLIPEFQGRGIGSKLLEELEEVGWRHGLEAIRVHSTPQSEMFYKKAGYAPVEPGSQLSHDHDGIELIKTRRTALS